MRTLCSAVIVASVSAIVAMAALHVTVFPAYVGCGGILVLAIFINLVHPRTGA